MPIQFNPQDPEHLLGEAIYLAAKVHRYQKDKTGVCYTLHPINVMLMRGDKKDRDVLIVSVLHDALEDFIGTAEEKQEFHFHIRMTFPEHIVDALVALTHKRKGEEAYDEYIERVAQNSLARRVKIRDLTHNMDPRRIPAGQIVDADFKRWDKYRKALIRLERED
jgi:(p)ppGpp synthase/HD superfamily hydrolase